MRKLFPRILVFALAGAASLVWPAFAETVPEEEPAVRAVQRVMPAVVNIATERVIRQSLEDPYELFFERYFGGPQSRPRELRRKVQSLGSGFLIDPEGYIVTNSHVVERAADLKIQVTTSDGKNFEARYVAGDPESDLALIKIENGGGLPFVSLDEMSPNLLGQTVLALGNPLGYGSSVSRGILSATNRTLSVEDVEYEGLVQTDAAINPGNSGGPLIDLAGRLVGMNSVKMAYTPQGIPAQGMGFAIPAQEVRKRVAEMRANGRRKGAERQAGVSAAEKMFGLRVEELAEEQGGVAGIEEARGVLIAEVEKGGPAERAGLTRGLVIQRVGRYEVSNVDDLERVLAKAESGQVADFTVGTTRRLGRRLVRQTDTVSVTAR